MVDVTVEFGYKCAVDPTVEFSPWHSTNVTVSMSSKDGDRESIEALVRELDDIVKVQAFTNLGQAFAYDEQGVAKPIVQNAKPASAPRRKNTNTNSSGGGKQSREALDAIRASAPKTEWNGAVWADLRAAKASGQISNPRYPDFVTADGEQSEWLTSKNGDPTEKGSALANVFDAEAVFA